MSLAFRDEVKLNFIFKRHKNCCSVVWRCVCLFNGMYTHTHGWDSYYFLITDHFSRSCHAISRMDCLDTYFPISIIFSAGFLCSDLLFFNACIASSSSALRTEGSIHIWLEPGFPRFFSIVLSQHFSKVVGICDLFFFMSNNLSIV